MAGDDRETPFIDRIEFSDTPEDKASVDTEPVKPDKSKPKRTRKAASTTPTRKKEPVKRKDEFVDPLMQMYTMAGGSMLMLAKATNRENLTPVAQSVISQAESCARAWDDLADKDESVRHALRLLCRGGAWGGVIAAHAPIILASISASGMIGGDNKNGKRIQDTDSGGVQPSPEGANH